MSRLRTAKQPLHAALHPGFAFSILAIWVVAMACHDDAPAPEAPATGSEARHPLDAHLDDRYRAGLDQVIERRFLRVLTSTNAFDYFIQDGKPGGYQYDMVRAFVKQLNDKYRKRSELPIQFELVPVAEDQLVPQLLDGRADMIAARTTITPERAAQVAFSIPYKSVVRQVVTRLDPAAFRSVEDLSGQRFAVRQDSGGHRRLVELNRQLESRDLAPIEIELLPGGLTTETILERVAKGVYDFTFADPVLAELPVPAFEPLEVLSGLSLRQEAAMAWATHPLSTALLAEMNAFLPSHRDGTLLGNIAFQKYFEDYDELSERLEAGPVSELSPYDRWFRKYSEQYGFDWRLVAAVAFQESRFRQEARSQTGAIGLFQLKPATARESYIGVPEIAGPDNAESNIHAGVKYLAWIKDRYFDAGPEMTERDRVRMTLASYNAGPATIRRARERAADMQLDPDRWFRNVELALLDLRKPEPVQYVSEINKRYVAYILLGVDE